MPKLTPEQTRDQHDAIVRAMKRVDAVPSGTVVQFNVKDYSVPFLKALQAYAKECRVHYLGAHGDYTVYRVTMRGRNVGGKRVPEALEIVHIWRRHPLAPR